MVRKRRALGSTLGRGTEQSELARKALQIFFANTEIMLSRTEDAPAYRFDRSKIYEEDDRFRRWR